MNPANIILILDLIISLTDRVASLSSLIKKARAEGRDVTEEEIQALVVDDDAAKKALDEAIAKAKAEAPPEG